MKNLDEVYPIEYLKQTYLKKKCTQCSNKCDKCTFELQVERFYVKHKGMDIPTVIYKCKDFELKEE